MPRVKTQVVLYKIIRLFNFDFYMSCLNVGK
jgi:hypothetical protein